ncbi:MAG: hypothetical protein JWL76_2276 [Thermoleophilia bacterium]|nr:hypothetical protein [Thermoleophilia bacterium]
MTDPVTDPFAESDALFARLVDHPETEGWFERERERNGPLARLLASPGLESGCEDFRSADLPPEPS